MALFIRDADVDAMAEEIKMLTQAPTKAAAVREALRAQLNQIRKELPIRERLKRARRLADALGPSDPSFDMKSFSDDMWGGI